MKKTWTQTGLNIDEKETTCIDLVFKDPDKGHRHIQFNGKWIIE